MVRVGLIGFGAIGRSVVEHLPAGCVVAGVLVRQDRAPEARRELAGAITVVTSVQDLLALEPEAVLECAGHEALRAHGETVLVGGADLVVISTGALADDGLRERLTAAAARGSARVVVPAGAIGGLDALGALRLGGLSGVRYTSIKPPYAWRGTPAADAVDLEAVRTATTVFEGTARAAGRLFPKNANVAITVALAAGMLDETRVKLVADPEMKENVGVIEAEGPFGTLKLELRGPASPDNPRTSAVTALRLVQALERRTAVLLI